MTLQKILITGLNKVYAKVVKDMDKSKKDFCLWLVFVFISMFFIMMFSKFFHDGFMSANYQKEILFSILLLAASVLSMEKEVKPVRFNKWVFTLLMLCSAGLIFTGILHHIGDGYLLFGFMLLIVYPCFYIVWNNRRDYETLFDLIAGANITVISVYVFYNLVKGKDSYLSSFFSLRFKGSTWNSNLYSMIGLTLFCCSLYFVYRHRGDIRRTVLYSLTTFMGLIVVLLGKSRAAILIVILAVAAMIIFNIKYKVRVNTANWKKLLLISCMLILCFICIMYIGNMGSSDDEASSEGGQMAISERFSVKGKDLNEYTTGRIELWSVYAPMLNMFGNDVDEINWDELPVTKSAHCHNNFLEYGYRCGIPVTLLFTALELIACLFAVVYMISRECKRDAYLFVIMMTAMYFINSLIDIATLPVERYAPFFFYLVLTVMLDPRPNSVKQKEKERAIYRDENNQYEQFSRRVVH